MVRWPLAQRGQAACPAVAASRRIGMRDLRLEADSVAMSLEAHVAPIRPVRPNEAGTLVPVSPVERQTALPARPGRAPARPRPRSGTPGREAARGRHLPGAARRALGVAILAHEPRLLFRRPRAGALGSASVQTIPLLAPRARSEERRVG